MHPDEDFLHQQIGQKFDEDDSKVPYLERSLNGAEPWTLRKVCHK
jgi:hypothetical protein